MLSVRAVVVLALLTATSGCVFDSSGISGEHRDASILDDTGLHFTDADTQVDAVIDSPSPDVFVPADWFDPRWHHRRSVRVQASVQQDADSPITALEDFPLLIRLQGDDHLKKNAQGPADFRLTDQAGNLLDIETEAFDKRKGDLALWVKVPQLWTQERTQLWLYYGADHSPAEHGTPTDVWTRGYASVWHFGEEPDGKKNDVQDSTGRHPGSSQGGMGKSNHVPGIAGKALLFDGWDDRIDLDKFDIVPDDNPDGITLEAWVRSTATTDTDQRIISKASSINGFQHWWMLDLTSTSSVRTRIKAAYGYVGQMEAGSLDMGLTHHLAATFDGHTLRLYVDGRMAEARSWAGGTLATHAGVAVAIGNQPFGAGERPFTGLIDEVRISTVARSEHWMHTQFLNQKVNQSLVILGQPESLQ